MPKKTVVIVGSLDTKGDEFAFIKDLIEAEGLNTLVVDFGVMGEPTLEPDITRDEVTKAGGGDLAYLAGALICLEGFEIVADQFGWALWIRQGMTVALLFGLLVTLLLGSAAAERSRFRTATVRCTQDPGRSAGSSGSPRWSDSRAQSATRRSWPRRSAARLSSARSGMAIRTFPSSRFRLRSRKSQ